MGIAFGYNDTFRSVHFLVTSFHELQSDNFSEVGIHGPGFLIEVLRILGVGVESLLLPGRGIDGAIFDARYLLDEVVDRASGECTDIIHLLRLCQIQHDQAVGMRIAGIEIAFVAYLHHKQDKGGKGSRKSHQV